MIYVERRKPAIEANFLDELADTCEILGHDVRRDAESAEGAELAIVWGVHDHGSVCAPKIYCELGWLPRWHYQVSHAGINADHHLAGEPLRDYGPLALESAISYVGGIRSAPAPYKYMDPAVAEADGLPDEFIFVPLQVEGDANMRHVPSELRTADGLVDHLSAWDPDVPLVFKCHPNSREHRRQKYIRPRRVQDEVRLHRTNVHSYLRNPGCVGVVTLNSNVAHDAILWGVPAIALAPGFWRGLGAFPSELPPHCETRRVLRDLQPSWSYRVAPYVCRLMEAQWDLDDAADEERVEAAITAALEAA